MIKRYKDNKVSLGYSDIASLVVVYNKEGFGAITELLQLGWDGDYTGYYVKDDEVEIPDYYTKEIKANNWLKIYDDVELVFEASADVINLYRAGGGGIIIQEVNEYKINREDYVEMIYDKIKILSDKFYNRRDVLGMLVIRVVMDGIDLYIDDSDTNDLIATLQELNFIDSYEYPIYDELEGATYEITRDLILEYFYEIDPVDWVE